MFSAALNTSTSLKCWCIMPMPRSKASLGEAMTTSRPSMAMVPSSGKYMPESMFMSVVLPEPFSPSRASISPLYIFSQHLSLASTLPKRLVMSRIATAGTLLSINTHLFKEMRSRRVIFCSALYQNTAVDIQPNKAPGVFPELCRKPVERSDHWARRTMPSTSMSK